MHEPLGIPQYFKDFVEIGLLDDAIKKLAEMEFWKF
jgi:hypothetical protein